MRFSSLVAVALLVVAPALAACPGEAEAPPRGRPCVDAEADALAKMREHFHLSEEATAGFTPSPTKVDLDHDGQLDHVYTFELNNESYTLVYAMKSACGEPMGAIPGPVTTLKTATRGFLDLKVTLDATGANWKVCKVGEEGYRCAEP
jgi:hypothetical protein